jgi:hypothetical protein
MIAAAIPVFLDRIGMALSRRIGNGCTWTKIAEFIRAVAMFQTTQAQSTTDGRIPLQV